MSDQKGKILLICTSCAKMPFADKSGGELSETGVWAEEAASPYLIFQSAGYDVDLCSIQGGKIPIDKNSLTGDFYTPSAKKGVEELKMFEKSSKLEDVLKTLSDSEKCPYKGLFLAGGHGTCIDFINNKTLSDVIKKVYNSGTGGVVAAVCHGVGAFCDVDGLLKNQAVTGFSDTEEGPGGVALLDKVPFSLEQKLKSVGGKYEKAEPWHSKVCVSENGKIVTGQNPQSSEDAAKKVVECIAK